MTSVSRSSLVACTHYPNDNVVVLFSRLYDRSLSCCPRGGDPCSDQTDIQIEACANGSMLFSSAHRPSWAPWPGLCTTRRTHLYQINAGNGLRIGGAANVITISLLNRIGHSVFAVHFPTRNRLSY